MLELLFALFSSKNVVLFGQMAVEFIVLTRVLGVLSRGLMRVT
jgi:hypothetical protein